MCIYFFVYINQTRQQKRKAQEIHGHFIAAILDRIFYRLYLTTQSLLIKITTKKSVEVMCIHFLAYYLGQNNVLFCCCAPCALIDFVGLSLGKKRIVCVGACVSFPGLLAL